MINFGERPQLCNWNGVEQPRQLAPQQGKLIKRKGQQQLAASNWNWN